MKKRGFVPLIKPVVFGKIMCQKCYDYGNKRRKEASSLGLY